MSSRTGISLLGTHGLNYFIFCPGNLSNVSPSPPGNLLSSYLPPSFLSWRLPSDTETRNPSEPTSPGSPPFIPFHPSPICPDIDWVRTHIWSLVSMVAGPKGLRLDGVSPGGGPCCRLTASFILDGNLWLLHWSFPSTDEHNVWRRTYIDICSWFAFQPAARLVIGPCLDSPGWAPSRNLWVTSLRGVRLDLFIRDIMKMIHRKLNKQQTWEVIWFYAAFKTLLKSLVDVGLQLARLKTWRSHSFIKDIKRNGKNNKRLIKAFKDLPFDSSDICWVVICEVLWQ